MRTNCDLLAGTSAWPDFHPAKRLDADALRSHPAALDIEMLSPTDVFGLRGEFDRLTSLHHLNHGVLGLAQRELQVSHVFRPSGVEITAQEILHLLRGVVAYDADLRLWPTSTQRSLGQAPRVRPQREKHVSGFGVPSYLGGDARILYRLGQTVAAERIREDAQFANALARSAVAVADRPEAASVTTDIRGG